MNLKNQRGQDNKSCEHKLFSDTERVFSDGTLHVERKCDECKKHLGFVAKAIDLSFEECAKEQMHFGKYKGKTITELHMIDPGYLMWLTEDNHGKITQVIKKYFDVIDSSQETMPDFTKNPNGAKL